MSNSVNSLKDTNRKGSIISIQGNKFAFGQKKKQKKNYILSFHEKGQNRSKYRKSIRWEEEVISIALESNDAYIFMTTKQDRAWGFRP